MRKFYLKTFSLFLLFIDCTLPLMLGNSGSISPTSTSLLYSTKHEIHSHSRVPGVQVPLLDIVHIKEDKKKDGGVPTSSVMVRPLKTRGTVSEPEVDDVFRREPQVHRHHSTEWIRGGKSRITHEENSLFSCRDTGDKSIYGKKRTSNRSRRSVKRITKQTKSFSPSVANLRCKRRSYHGVGPPSFHHTSPTNVTAQLGANAYLPCKIRNLGNKSVSWFRQRDSHILTVDRVPFIADGRFGAWHETSKQSWTLHIRYVQPRDAGIYECQVSTEPKMSLYVQLTVLKPSSAIIGETEQYVRVGSTVTLKCLIENALEEPEYIFWYQNGLRVVQTGAEDRLISAQRKPPATSLISLTIPSVTMKDSGNYTCAPASISPSSVTLHILHDEHPAAMQHGNTNSCPKYDTTLTRSLVVTLLSLLLTELTDARV